MNTSVGWATLDVIPSVRGLRGELDRQVTPGLSSAGTRGGRLFGDSAGREASARFGSAVRRGARVAAFGLAAASAAAFKFGGDALEEAREAQKVGAQTNAVIKSTGRVAKVSAKDVARLSNRLSDMAGVDDELIQSGANVLLTFKNIRNEGGKGNKIFDEAAESVLNLSAAMDMDLKSASVQVGKALNDPVKGLVGLSRAGVQFSEDQKTAVKAMVESGDILGAQKIILKELDDQFAGSAKAQATEADKLGVAYNNLKEDVGTALIPVMDDLAVFLRKKGIPAARDAAGWIRDDFAPAVKNAAEDVKPLIDGVKDLARFLNDLPSGAKIAGITALIGGTAALKLRGGGPGALGAAGSALGLARPIPVFVTNAGGFGGGLGGDDIGGGKGGKGGAWGKAGKVLAAAFVADVAYEATAGDLFGFDSTKGPRQTVSPFGVGLDPNRAPSGGGSIREREAALSEQRNQNLRDFFLAGEKASKVAERLGIVTDANVGKFEAFFRSTSDAKTGLDKVKRSADILTAKPIQPRVDTTDIERAIALLNTMQGLANRDNFGDRGFTGGDSSVTPLPNNHPRAGVTIERMDVHGLTMDDALRDGQRRLRRAGLGGRP